MLTVLLTVFETNRHNKLKLQELAEVLASDL